MKAVFTKAALDDLDQLLTYTSVNYPSLLASVGRRIRDVIVHIEAWPENARRVSGRQDVRVVPLIRYPYRIFYRVHAGRIEILHIHHTARQPWAE